MNIVLTVLLIPMLVLLIRNYRNAAAYKLQARSRVFENCASLLQQAHWAVDKAHLPILQGQYAGYAVAFSIVEDTTGWRKVPPLWLLVKVSANKISHGSLDFIVRPTSNEFYSPSWQWDSNLAIPPTWPQHAILKYQQTPVNVDVLSSYVPALFADANMKELLIMPNMLRLTYLAKQAERGEYLIMRNAVYADTPLAQNMVEHVLKQAVAIRQAVEDEPPTPAC